MKTDGNLTRRAFVRTAGTAVAAFTIVPGEVLGRNGRTPPSEKLNIAGIGVGGMGAGDIDAVAPGNHIVALCDVDNQRSGSTFKKYPEAKQFRDFREMLDTMDRQIDAVVVATPDHCHAVAAMAAIKRAR